VATRLYSSLMQIGHFQKLYLIAMKNFIIN